MTRSTSHERSGLGSASSIRRWRHRRSPSPQGETKRRSSRVPQSGEEVERRESSIAAFDEPLDHDVGNATIERLGPEMSGGRHRLLVMSERVDVHLVCRVQLFGASQRMSVSTTRLCLSAQWIPAGSASLSRTRAARWTGAELNAHGSCWVPFPAVGSGSKRRDRTCSHEPGGHATALAAVRRRHAPCPNDVGGPRLGHRHPVSVIPAPRECRHTRGVLHGCSCVESRATVHRCFSSEASREWQSIDDNWIARVVVGERRDDR